MTLTRLFLIAFVAIEHLCFLILEMFLWTTTIGVKAFGLQSKRHTENTKLLAANQGLYNGFLVAGLIVSIIENNANFAVFFLTCICSAGIYGTYHTKQKKVVLCTKRHCHTSPVVCFHQYLTFLWQTINR